MPPKTRDTIFMCVTRPVSLAPECLVWNFLEETSRTRSPRSALSTPPSVFCPTQEPDIFWTSLSSKDGTTAEFVYRHTSRRTSGLR